MDFSRIAPIVLLLTLTTGCGGESVATATRTPAEAVAEQAGVVKISERVRLDFGETVNIAEYSESRTAGVLRLGAAASDLTTVHLRTDLTEDLKAVVPASQTTRVISVGDSGSYVQGADKVWLHYGSPTCRVLTSLDARAVLSPKVLQILAAPAPSSGEVIDSVPTVEYAGNAPQTEFGIPDTGNDPAAADQVREHYGAIEVSWQLWVGPDQLPRRARLTTVNPEPEDGMPGTITTEIDFTGWGSDVSIKPPPKKQVQEAGGCPGEAG
ncbi:hypothetical protein ACIBG8_04800 [Nonomuraea sp. NPDC050556]|uniref:hypothetical protein n=1 Tax=Nonomuraea sp. NPDC050556 TaxID=3364369 RepID=UPI00379BF9CF